jgi:fumarate reductase flavoprotein subunit
MIKRLLVTWQHPDDAMLADGAILVNRDGRRFCDEEISPDREIAVAGQPDKQAFMLLDETLIERYGSWPHFVSTAPEIAYAYVSDYLRLRPDIAVAGASLAEIAHARHLPSGTLEETVAGYRASFGDPSSTDVPRTGGRPLDGSRWVLLGPLKAYFTNTEGGAAIDHDLRVLDGSGRPIPGLYAAGQTGLGGMVLWGHGLHIAWALTSGRLVGEVLGREVPAPMGRAGQANPGASGRSSVA